MPPFPLELAKRNIFVRSIDRNPKQNDEGGAFPLVRRASSSDMMCYSVVHLLHFYVSKSLHSFMGGVQNNGGADFDRGITIPCKIMEHCE